MQQFLSDTLAGRYIKAILSNIELPKFPTVQEDDFITVGMTYIYKNDVIRCTSSGFLTSFRYEPAAKFDIISEYIFGDHIPKLSSKFISNAGYYDPNTHKELGHYLRCLRDLKGIDLMPLYNCYANEYSSGYRLSLVDGVVEGINSTNKVYLVPIKFNKTYSIAIDAPSQVVISSAFIHKGSLLTVDATSLTGVLKQYIQNYTTSALNTNFLHPITYNVDLSNVASDTARYKLASYEKYLYMLVQVPITCDSSFVVLEGDYTTVGTKYVFDAVEVFNNGGNVELEHLANSRFVSKLSLLKFNDRHTYAFSDRLIEYLLNNAISTETVIKNNIKRVQAGIKFDNYYKADEYTKDVWDFRLRKLLFDKYTEANPLIYDILGFVDKDVEAFITNAAYMEDTF